MLFRWMMKKKKKEKKKANVAVIQRDEYFRPSTVLSPLLYICTRIHGKIGDERAKRKGFLMISRE